MAESKTIKTKKLTTSALVVEDNAIIININGWRMRVYFELKDKDLKLIQKNKKDFEGRSIEVEYIGDLKDVHNLKLLPITQLF